MLEWGQISLALVEGLGVSFSACILPILPVLFAASSVGGRLRPLQIVLGFIASFTLFSLISRQLLLATGLELDKIQRLAFLMILFFGLIMIIPKLQLKFSSISSSLANSAQNLSRRAFFEKPGAAFAIGALLGLVWLPCAGPILAVALLQVIQSKTNEQAFFIILFFSLGTALPMLLVGFFSQALSKQLQKIVKKSERIRQLMGLCIVVFALFGLFGFNLSERIAEYRFKNEPILRQNRLIKPLNIPYKAPDLVGIQHWINTPPLSLKTLKGKVVLIDFWTYSCINCIRTLPFLKDWYQKYKKEGLEIIGVHAPEFAFEQEPANVQKAVKRFNLSYPIALDNQLASWQNYNNQYWPAHYLINKDGLVVYIHFGEGEYNVMENNIRFLLNLDNKIKKVSPKQSYQWNQTPETYLGSARAQRESKMHLLPLHHWQLSGPWARHEQFIENTAIGASLTLHYRARKVFLVITNTENKSGKLEVVEEKGQKIEITIQEPKLYLLLDNGKTETAKLVIRTLTPHLKFYALTFE